MEGYRNLFKKPWVFVAVLNINPNLLGLKGQDLLIRFLHQEPCLPRCSWVSGIPSRCSGAPFR